MTQLSPTTGGGGFSVSPQQGGGTGVFGNPGPQGTSPSDQAQGNPQLLGTFSATAYGPPWTGIQGTGVTADGTDLRPAKKVYGVAVDPTVIPLGTYLNIQPNPFDWNGTFKAFDTGGAIKGKRIDFYDWRGRSTQTKWGRQNVQVYRAASPNQKLDKPASGGGIHISNPLNAVDDMASAVKSFIDFVLSPKSIGDLLAKIAAYFVKLIWKALWNYVIAPIFHWHQRAVLVYWREITDGDKQGVKAFVTLSFWATGYAILWARVDKDLSLVTEPQRTPLGSLLRAFGNTAARRKLVKPKDVKKKTPDKPEPVKSSARLTQTRTMSAARRRTVKIGGTEDHERLSEWDSPGTGDTAPPPPGTPRADNARPNENAAADRPAE